MFEEPIFFIVSGNDLKWGWNTFPVLAQIVNILCLAVHTVSVTTSQLCHCNLKAAGE